MPLLLTSGPTPPPCHALLPPPHHPPAIPSIGYYKNISQWSKGEYSAANNLQDDLATMTDPSRLMTVGYGFLRYRPDDHGDTPFYASPLIGTASPSNPARTTASAAGNIETTGDADCFRIWASVGTVNVAVALVPNYTVSLTSNSRANADMQLSIYTDGAASPFFTSNPQGSVLLNGTSTFTALAEGYYYACLTGTGDGADATVGYSSYGSLGEYKITCDYVTPVNPAPAASPAPSPPPSPPPSPYIPTPPQGPVIIIKLVSSKAVKSSGRYRIDATLKATDGNGIALSKKSVAITCIWIALGSGSYPQTSIIKTYTTSSTGTLPVISSPYSPKLTGGSTLTLVSVTSAGYTWDRVNSNVLTSHLWP